MNFQSVKKFVMNKNFIAAVAVTVVAAAFVFVQKPQPLEEVESFDGTDDDQISD